MWSNLGNYIKNVLVILKYSLKLLLYGCLLFVEELLVI